jgi:hypothetical protein
VGEERKEEERDEKGKQKKEDDDRDLDHDLEAFLARVGNEDGREEDDDPLRQPFASIIGSPDDRGDHFFVHIYETAVPEDEEDG